MPSWQHEPKQPCGTEQREGTGTALPLPPHGTLSLPGGAVLVPSSLTCWTISGYGAFSLPLPQQLALPRAGWAQLWAHTADPSPGPAALGCWHRQLPLPAQGPAGGRFCSLGAGHSLGRGKRIL